MKNQKNFEDRDNEDVKSFSSGSSSSEISSSSESEKDFDNCSTGTSSCSGKYGGDKKIPIIDSDLYFAVKRAMSVYMY